MIDPKEYKKLKEYIVDILTNPIVNIEISSVEHELNPFLDDIEDYDDVFDYIKNRCCEFNKNGKLTKLDLMEFNITKIPDYPLPFENIEHFSIDGYLEKIPANIFDNTPKLKKTHLGSDLPIKMPNNLFHRFTEMTIISIFGRIELEIPDGIFDTLKKIRFLNLKIIKKFNFDIIRTTAIESFMIMTKEEYSIDLIKSFIGIPIVGITIVSGTRLPEEKIDEEIISQFDRFKYRRHIELYRPPYSKYKNWLIDKSGICEI